MGLFSSIGHAFSGILHGFTGLIGGVLGGLFGGPKMPEAPKVTPATPIPLPDDEAIEAAKRRSIAAQMQRSGRSSTMLTSDPVTGDTLGS